MVKQVLEAIEANPQAVLSVCCSCKRPKIQGEFVDFHVIDASQARPIYDRLINSLRVTHGLCDPCNKTLYGEFV